MIIVNVNLIGFSSNKSVGTLIYAKRLFKQIYKIENSNFCFIFYKQKQFDLSDWCLPLNSEIIEVPNMKSPLLRRLYEHTLFRLKLKKADYIFTPYLTVPFLFTNSKQIVTIHDMVPFMLPNKYNSFKLSLLKFETIIASVLSSKIVTVSENSKKDICFITKIDNNKVHVIYNFIRNDELVVLGKNNVVMLEQFGLCKPYFLTVATLQPGKNIERLIRSFGHFIQTNPEFQLCIVGNKGWGFTSIFEEVKKYHLEDKIIFTGYVNDEILDILYTNSFGVAYVSLYEGFGIPPLEGFYHNKPAIVSNNSSLPEVVGNAAIMVDPTDEEAIARGFAEFLNERNELKGQIQNQLDKFNPEKIVLDFLNLF